MLAGRYLVHKQVKRGGVGAVYRAYDQQQAREVAVKEVPVDASGLGEESAQQQRFVREASMLRALSHPQIPQVVDHFVEGDAYYLVMEYVEGDNLAELVTRSASGLPHEQVVAFALQICRILRYLHERPDGPVLHRDVKPSNLIVRGKSSQLVLVDFGLARTAKQITVTAAGTLRYCAPEQLTGRPEPRSDIYALGATMFQLMSGREPVPLRVCQPRQACRFVRAELADLVEKATQQDAAARFASAADMEAALLLLEYQPARPQPAPAIEPAAPAEKAAPARSFWRLARTYRYQGLTADGKPVGGRIKSMDLRLALQGLRDNKVAVTEIASVGRLDAILALGPRRVNPVAICQMTRNLALLLRSGVRLEPALRILQDQESDAELNEILGCVRQSVSGGHPLSDSMRRFPGAFGVVYLSMVKIGEKGGGWVVVLDRLADFLERDLKLRQRASAAMVYPCFVLLVCVLVFGLIFMYVLPPLLGIFTTMSGAKLPLPTRALMATVAALSNRWVRWGTLGSILYYQVWLRDYAATDQGRKNLDRLKLSLPLLGPLHKKMLVAHFCRGASVLLLAGVPLNTAVETLLRFMDNEFFKAEFGKRILDGLREGEELGQAISATGFFPSLALAMVKVGESTGELGTLMDKTSRMYDQEVEHSLEQALVVLEPLMIGVMGVLVCFVLLAVFLPLYQTIMSLS